MLHQSRSLEKLDGENWGEPDTAPTPMVAKCLQLRRTPLRELGHADLRLLISQQIGLQHLVPEALELIRENTLLQAEFYPGDLLCALLHVDRGYWSRNPVQMSWLASLARSGIDRHRTIVGDYEAFLAANCGPGETRR